MARKAKVIPDVTSQMEIIGEGLLNTHPKRVQRLAASIMGLSIPLSDGGNSLRTSGCRKLRGWAELI